MIRTYTELSKIDSFKGRYEYLKMSGRVGEETFGFERYLNQIFYHSKEWSEIRNIVIIRDLGCDLGLKGYEIAGSVIIHHLNPIRLFDLENRTSYLLDPEYMVCASSQTHKALHYSNDNLLILEHTARTKNDTCPWRK